MGVPAIVPFKRFINVAAAAEIGAFPPLYVNNTDGNGLYMEWKIEKTYKQDPGKMDLRIFNLQQKDRDALSTVAGTPPGLPELDFPISLDLGWDGSVMRAFSGNVRIYEPERAKKTADQRNNVSRFYALDGVPVKELVPASGSPIARQATAAGHIQNIANILGADISPAARALTIKAAAKVPLLKWAGIQSFTDPKEALNRACETLRISWALEPARTPLSSGKKLVLILYDRAVNNLSPQVFLSYSSGLLSYEIKSDGRVLIHALCIPAVECGGPVTLYDKQGKAVLGSDSTPLRIDTIRMEGNTDGKSEMRLMTRTPTAAVQSAKDRAARSMPGNPARRL